MDSNTDVATNDDQEFKPQHTLAGEKAARERSKRKDKGSIPSLKVARNGHYSVEPEDHRALMSAIAAPDWDFYEGVIRQAVNAGWTSWEYDEVISNFVLSVVKGIEPRDQVETMIALQIGVVHCATMKWSPELFQSPTPEWLDRAGRTMSQLVRTFAALVETLKRHRSRGEQKVTVQHVSIADGGQAVVSQNVSRRGRKRRRRRSAGSAPRLSPSEITPMEILDEGRGKAAANDTALVDSHK